MKKRCVLKLSFWPGLTFETTRIHLIRGRFELQGLIKIKIRVFWSLMNIDAKGLGFWIKKFSVLYSVFGEKCKIRCLDRRYPIQKESNPKFAILLEIEDSLLFSPCVFKDNLPSLILFFGYIKLHSLSFTTM